MDYEIEWTAKALTHYAHIINYLYCEWSQRVAGSFIEKIERRTNNLSKQPYTGIASSGYPGIRSVVITKHNKLFYKTGPEAIEILSIFDTRQNPNKNKYG